MNRCRKCNSLFRARESQIKKYDLLCQPCSRSYFKAYRAKRKEVGNSVIPTKMPLDYHRKYDAEYFKSPMNKKRRNENAKKYYQDPKNTHKNAARTSTRLSIKKGVLLKKPCEVCGKKTVDAHHSDYSKPLEIMWLCREHHVAWHKKHKAKGE